MPRIIPFKALRPCPEYAAQIAAPPYDVLNSEEARAMAEGVPYSFLHIDKAEIDLPRDISLYDNAVYAKARENLLKLINEGLLIQDKTPNIYIYRLEMEGVCQTGLACCVAVEDYEKGSIKKHELTRPDKERDRVNHINACGAHTGPILMAYRAGGGDTKALVKGWTYSHTPDYSFEAADGIRHMVWVVAEEDSVRQLCLAFSAIDHFYIADGHHRSAAAAAIAKNRPGGGRDEFLAVIFPDDELKIMDYNRVIRDLNGRTAEDFISALEQYYTVEEGETHPLKPGQFGLYTAGVWYTLTYNPPRPEGAVEGLDVSILQNTVLTPLLGISDPQRDKRIDFVGGIRGTKELTRRVDSGEMAAAFALSPTSMQELMTVADKGQIMPPKSTWFEPKLRSGLLIHSFDM